MDDNQVNEINLKGKDVIVEENRIVDHENQVMDEIVVDLRSERKFIRCSSQYKLKEKDVADEQNRVLEFENHDMCDLDPDQLKKIM
ncbi:hypothetical protein Tco_0877761 [Tanacetum coccineum]|uniref:Uncharacterized protein n=1 Tax=Tanacetum coccineum TaxID=301880 RepID=A0ABQ5BW31_9ASTR